jgi:hypothetical protein
MSAVVSDLSKSFLAQIKSFPSGPALNLMEVKAVVKANSATWCLAPEWGTGVAISEEGEMGV